MRTLVIGATGFLGSYVAKELKDAGISFRCLVRQGSDTKILKKLGIPTIYGDIRHKNTLKKAIKEADTVINMAAILSASSKRLYYDVNYKGVRNIVEVCTRYKVKRLIHVSTGDVIFRRGDYSISKLKGEEAVRKSNLDFTILRPTAIFGKGECDLTTLLYLVRRLPIIPVIGDGKNKLQPVYARDVAKAIVKIIKSKKTVGKTYSLGGSDQISLNSLLDLIMKELGVKKAKMHIPVSFATPFVQVYERVVPNPFITLDKMTLLTYDKICDNSEAIRDLKLNPTGINKGIKYLLK